VPAERFAMDVKCERCTTEYEFDDALVSGRGTTVKCTNCGHKFKIRRDDGDFSEDFWNVTTGDGRTLVFTSLRELQRAIQSYLVDRNDRLSRGGLPPKPIGQIPELIPFFERDAARRPPGRTTQSGVGPEAEESSPGERQTTIAEFPAPPPAEPLRAQKSTLLGTGPVTTAPALAPAPRAPSIPPPVPRAPSIPPPVPRAPSIPPPVPARARDEIDTAPLDLPSPPPRKSIPPPLPEVTSAGASEAPPPQPRRERTTPLPRVARSLVSEVDDQPSSLPDGAPPRRRGVGGVVVAVVVAGCVLILGAAWAQKHLGATLGAKAPAPAPAVDPRVADLLAAGERSLAGGDVDLAKESFDRASALADKDPHVLVAFARLAAVRADVPWLESRLLPENAADERRVARDALEELATRARKAADDALAAAPEDPSTLRARIDAARISGDREGARALVAKLTSSQRAADGETAYVLAALDLAEAEPLWPTVIERLKMASSAETGPGRARAALVYALARSGDHAGAKDEVERLGAMSKAHPLLPLLRAFTDPAAKDGAVDAGAPDAAVLVEPHAKARRQGGGGGGGIDARDLLVQGERARARGELEKARGFFNAALDRNPNDSEALAGLGAISYAQHDPSGARAAYNRVLAINPNYLPAVVGLADLEWDSGSKAAAARMYKDIVDRYPEGAYPARVKQRAEGGG
jgi:predicted Zn finger-like uncharacterized protein